jgi:hypothetical protein
MRKAEVGLLTLMAVAMPLPVACKCFDGAM